MTSEFYVAVGDEVTFSKTVAESDVYLFAGITGDLAPNHVDAEYMKRSAYGRRIAHGALLVGYMSTASTRIIQEVIANETPETPVSLGYDRIRFLKPVFIDDTITVRYVIAEIDVERRRSRANIGVTNQHGETVAVAEHILKWVPNP
jgi:3-hydroxybutyryl-CoA dehydratase